MSKVNNNQIGASRPEITLEDILRDYLRGSLTLSTAVSILRGAFPIHFGTRGQTQRHDPERYLLDALEKFESQKKSTNQ
jgi:hypothetical protein